MRRWCALGLAPLAGLALWVALTLPAVRAEAADSAGGCSHAVVFALPGITWADIERWRPPQLLGAARAGAIASISVRTVRSETTLAAGFATLGAGARVDGGRRAGRPQGSTGHNRLFQRGVRVSGIGQLKELAGRAGYGAQPGALAAAFGRRGPVVAIGNADLGPPPGGRPGRWSLLAAMDDEGVVDRAATGPRLLRRAPAEPFGVRADPATLDRSLGAALGIDCSVVIVDVGDLERADIEAQRAGRTSTAAVRRALLSTDEALGSVRALLEPADLLLVVSPTSPRRRPEPHLGVTIAEGGGVTPGGLLESPATRRPGLVTLADVGPTVLRHLGVSRPASMTGRAMGVAPGGGDRVSAAVALDAESTFVDGLKGAVTVGFVAFQIVVYSIGAVLITRNEWAGRRFGGRPRRVLEWSALGAASFPVSAFLAGGLAAHELGTAFFVLALLALTALLATAITLLVSGLLDRLLSVVALTTAVIAADLAFGGPLQMNTVLGYSPIGGGRFAGLGNVGFALLAVSSLLTGTMVVHRFAGARVALAAVAVLFVATIVVDGAPQLGADVGGTLALVPGLGVAWVLLAGRRPSWRVVALAGLATVLAVALFLALDLARSPDRQTHLARLFEGVRSQGLGLLGDTIARKARANLHIFTVTIWSYFLPPAVGVIAWLLVRPRGRWQRLAETFPRMRAGLLGGLVLGVLGFAVNDSGIVIPAVMLSLLVPAALLVHLRLEDEGSTA